MSRRRRFTTTVGAVLLAGGVLVAYTVGAFGSSGGASTGQASATLLVGPGPVAAALNANGYRVALHWTPNTAFAAGKISIAVTNRGAPVTDAHVRVTFTMLDMKMNGLTGLLPQIAPGTYGHFGPILDMPGHWGIRFNITPPRATPFTVTFTDNVRG
jgi:hypothetical protein